MACGAVFGWSNQLHTGPVAMTALLTAAVLASSGFTTGSPEFVSAAVALSMIVGLIRLSIGLFRLSFIVNVLSHPVLVGFTNAAAIIIAASQLPSLLRVQDGGEHSFIPECAALVARVGNAHLPTMVFGLGAIALMLAVRKWMPRWPAALVATVIATFAAVLVMAPDMTDGILVGILLALGLHIYDIMKPHVAVLGRHPDGTLRDAVRHNLPVDPRILAFRFDGRLIFANASYFVESILEARAEHMSTKAILVVAEGINEIDASGEDALRRLVAELRESGMEIAFSQLKSQVLDVLRRSGLYAVIGETNMFRTPEAAWMELERRLNESLALKGKA